MDPADIPALLARLASDEDASRKMAIFKLQSCLTDPSFADVFISRGGLVTLRRLIMTSGGNTLAYGLQSLSRLLEVDMGWDLFESAAGSGELVERVVELVCTNPLVNILRGAMAILVALISRTQTSTAGQTSRTALEGRMPGMSGFRALKPAVAVYPQFFEVVIKHLQSADHLLCANALMLINALIRDQCSHDDTRAEPKGSGASGPEAWVTFVKKLQDLGLIRAIYKIMQSSTIHDLAHPLLEFQNITKVLLKKWRSISVDQDRQEHRRALKGLHLSSNPEKKNLTNGTTKRDEDVDLDRKNSKKHSPEKWRRLGFQTESPVADFDVAGYLGMMDLTDYVRKHEDGFQKMLLEQSSKPLGQRCPIAKASLAVTMILYEHFDVDSADLDDTTIYRGLDEAQNYEVFKPLLLQWSRLHTAGLHAFFRIWKATGADRDDFDKVAEPIRILVEQVSGRAGRTKDVQEVEEELQEYDAARLRELQMELLDQSFEGQWGQHLVSVKDELRRDAMQFVKEQRIRCLLQGSWFYKPPPKKEASGHQRQQSIAERRLQTGKAWRFVKLSHNRRYLHWAEFSERRETEPSLDDLAEKLDLSIISSVVSNVTAPVDNDAQSASSAATLKKISGPPQTARSQGKAAASTASTKITIYRYLNAEEIGGSGGDGQEAPLLTLVPADNSLASEWLDGLLMLLNQSPITSETSKLASLVSDYGLKIRLLNVRQEAVYEGPSPGAGVVPSREGLDDDYFYDL